MPPLPFLLAPVAVGLVVGRWWALGFAVAFGAWVAATTDVEVPVAAGLGMGLWAAAGIAAGVAIRRALARRGR